MEKHFLRFLDAPALHQRDDPVSGNPLPKEPANQQRLDEVAVTVVGTPPFFFRDIDTPQCLVVPEGAFGKQPFYSPCT